VQATFPSINIDNNDNNNNNSHSAELVHGNWEGEWPTSLTRE